MKNRRLSAVGRAGGGLAAALSGSAAADFDLGLDLLA